MTIEKTVGFNDRCLTYGPYGEYKAYVVDTPQIGETPVSRLMNERCAALRRGLGVTVASISLTGMKDLDY